MGARSLGSNSNLVTNYLKSSKIANSKPFWKRNSRKHDSVTLRKVAAQFTRAKDFEKKP
jgi:hypothetical protein